MWASNSIRFPRFLPLPPLGGGISYSPGSKVRALPPRLVRKIRATMQLSQSMGVRLEQRQLLTPRMIQSMEILQLPLMALEERIEQELQNNPVLESREGDAEGTDGEAPAAIENVEQERREDFSEGEQPLVVKDQGGAADDFDRLARISDYFENE